MHGISGHVINWSDASLIVRITGQPLVEFGRENPRGRKFTETERVDHQWCSRWLLPPVAQVGPFLRDGETAEIRMAQAQRGDARDTSHFEDDEALTTQRVEWMSDLSRTQRLADQCSSTGPCRP